MNFNLGQLVASGKIQVFIIIVQIIVLVISILFLIKNQNKMFILSIIVSNMLIISSMFYHHLDTINVAIFESGITETVLPQIVIRGLQLRHVFFSYELVIGFIIFLLSIFFVIKKGKIFS